MAHTRCSLDKQGYTQAHAGARRQICSLNTFWFLRQQWFREHAVVLSFTYIASIVGFLYGVQNDFTDDVSELTMGPPQ